MVRRGVPGNLRSPRNIEAVVGKTLSAFEHDRLPVTAGGSGEALSEREAVRLTELASLRPGFCARGHQSVRFAQFVGLVGLGERVLELLPKTVEGDSTGRSRATLLSLLQLSRNLKSSRVGQATHDLDRHTLLEVFISAFFDEVAGLVRAGLVRRYLRQEEVLPVIRGRFLVGRHTAQRGPLYDRVVCGFDDLTSDHLLNRVLHAALDATRPWIDSLDLGRRRLDLVNAFADVELVRVSAEEVEALALDRQTATYGPALEWAKFILRNLSPALRSGQARAPGLIFDMNQLFERAIANLMRRKTSPHETLTTQHTGLHLAQLADGKQTPRYGMRPDIVVERGERPIAVADTKWARVSTDSNGFLVPEREHVYQMQAYASVYPCEEFALVYPWHVGLAGARPTTLRLPRVGDREPFLSVFCIDVASASMAAHGPATGTIATLLEVKSQ